MKVETKLARAFKAVAGHEEQIESTAGGILSIVRSIPKLTVESFDAVVMAAYEENGWNVARGRPSEDAEQRDSVPSTVRTYVSLVRAAIRNNMKLGKYPSFTALRAALARKTTGRDHRGVGRPSSGVLRLPPALAESFVGVEITRAEPNGALFHDLGVVFAKLPEDHQAMLGRQLARLLHKYLPLAGLPRSLPAPVAADERKAA